MARPDIDEYRIFTTRFDREVDWRDLDSVLGPLPVEDAESLSVAFAEFEKARTAWDSAAGVPDLTAMPDGIGPGEAAVTLLLDQSGSMRGRPMALAAAAIAEAVRQLRANGCRVEVLGFTTASWRGGRPRRRWKWRLRPRQPGRLCELLHVVYRDGEETTDELPDAATRSMLRPDLPKENIDGEAVLWAAGRLLTRPEANKILIVLSDGSPVDDSTQQANGPYFLDTHLRSVVEAIGLERRIQLAAVGIGHDVSGWYANSISVPSIDDLGPGSSGFLNALLFPLATEGR